MNLYQLGYEVKDLGKTVEADRVFVYGEDGPQAMARAQEFLDGIIETFQSPTLRGELKSMLQLPSGTVLAAAGMVVLPVGTDLKALSEKVVTINESSKVIN